MIDPELAAINQALVALSAVPPFEWQRALNYLADRLSERDRTVHLIKTFERPAPTQFIHEGDMACPYADAEDLVRDTADTLVPFEVNGVAVVSQRFALVIPIADEAGERE